jgi:hypothetical protein
VKNQNNPSRTLIGKMATTTLQDALTSDFLLGSNVLAPKTAPKTIFAYVEGREDIPFWCFLLEPFEREAGNIKFEILTPTNNEGKSETGKQSVLKMKNSVGPYLILCVDSDYDYLLQEATPTSKEINNNAYIFQTYSYSTENLQCYAPSLQSLCTYAANGETFTPKIDFEHLLGEYSQIIYPLFLWSVHFAENKNSNAFPISAFCGEIQIPQHADYSEDYRSTMQDLLTRIGKR